MVEPMDEADQVMPGEGNDDPDPNTRKTAAFSAVRLGAVYPSVGHLGKDCFSPCHGFMVLARSLDP